MWQSTPPEISKDRPFLSLMASSENRWKNIEKHFLTVKSSFLIQQMALFGHEMRREICQNYFVLSDCWSVSKINFDWITSRCNWLWMNEFKVNLHLDIIQSEVNEVCISYLTIRGISTLTIKIKVCLQVVRYKMYMQISYDIPYHVRPRAYLF